jgi:hypothetical protein
MSYDAGLEYPLQEIEISALTGTGLDVEVEATVVL